MGAEAAMGWAMVRLALVTALVKEASKTAEAIPSLAVTCSAWTPLASLRKDRLS